MYQFLFSKVPMLTYIQGSVLIGSSGAVTSSNGNGISSVTKLGTGIYQVQLLENINAFMSASFMIEGGTTGSPVADGSFVSGTEYQITVVGTTNWAAIGLPADMTAAVGQVFVATGVGGAGTGTATAVGKSGIFAVEMATPSAMLASSSPSKGAIFIFQTYNASGALTSPASSSRIHFDFILRNSSVAY